MATSDQVSARFRSATEFPKTIEGLEGVAADSLYVEMRDCLIFTNRSRAQLTLFHHSRQSKISIESLA